MFGICLNGIVVCWLTSSGDASHTAAKAVKRCEEAFCSTPTASLSAHSGGRVYSRALATSPASKLPV